MCYIVYNISNEQLGEVAQVTYSQQTITMPGQILDPNIDDEDLSVAATVIRQQIAESLRLEEERIFNDQHTTFQ